MAELFFLPLWPLWPPLLAAVERLSVDAGRVLAALHVPACLPLP